MDSTQPGQERDNPSYQHAKPLLPTGEIDKAITEAIASVDKERIRYLKTLSLPERGQIAFMMIELDEQNAVNRLRQIVPELDGMDALRMIRGGQKNYLWQRCGHNP